MHFNPVKFLLMYFATLFKILLAHCDGLMVFSSVRSYSTNQILRLVRIGLTYFVKLSDMKLVKIFLFEESIKALSFYLPYLCPWVSFYYENKGYQKH